MMLRSVMLLALAAGLLAGPARPAQGAEERVCIPGQSLILVGVAPSSSGLLVRFGDRIVAGAGVSGDGRYHIDLQIGPETPGRYPVAIEVRGTRQVVQLLTCVVPGAGDRAMVDALNPTPTVVPVPTAAPAPPAAPAPSGGADQNVPAGATSAPTARPAAQRQVQGQAPRGWAELSADAPLLIAVPPQGDGDVVTSYRRGSRVRLLGQMYLRWVQVQPAEGVAIGWMDAAVLRLLSGTPGPEPTGAPADELPDAPGAAPTDATLATPTTGVPTPTALLTSTGSLTPTASLTPPSSTTGQARALVVELLAPSPTSAPAPAPVARTLTVTVCRSRTASGTTAATCATAVGGTRVELALASTHELLASGTTAPDGTTTLAVSAPAGAALLLRLPAIGVAGAITEREVAITVALPPSLVLNGGAR